MIPARTLFQRFSGSSPKTSDDIAAHWLVRREAGLTEEEQKELRHWIAEDTRHAAAMQRIETSWRYMQKPCVSWQNEAIIRGVEQRVQARRRRRRNRSLGLAAVTAAAAITIAILPFRVSSSTASSRVVESVRVTPESRLLGDGSVVELNAGAEIVVNFTPELREVRLVRGEAHFAVAHEAIRPFVVQAGAVSVRAVGTKFALRFEPATVNVLVTEGRVAVQRAETSTMPSAAPKVLGPTYVDAGVRAVVPIAALSARPLQVLAVTSDEIRSALAWRSMRIEFTGMPLREVVERFNRHNRLQLVLGEPQLGDVRISGIFWADDPEGFSRLIETSAGLHATRASKDRLVLAAQHEQAP